MCPVPARERIGRVSRHPTRHPRRSRRSTVTHYHVMLIIITKKKISKSFESINSTSVVGLFYNIQGKRRWKFLGNKSGMSALPQLRHSRMCIPHSVRDVLCVVSCTSHYVEHRSLYHNITIMYKVHILIPTKWISLDMAEYCVIR